MSEIIDNRDQEILKKIASGDKEAFGELYDLYTPILFPLIKKIVTEEKTAEYILSEVYNILWVKSPVIKIKSVYTWLINLARNRAIDSLRRSRSTSDTIDYYDDEYEDFFVLPTLSPLIKPSTAEQVLENRQNIKDALDSLTEAQRYVIHLSFYEGLNLNEIAQKLQIPVETVRTKILIALENLNSNLAKNPVENG